MPRLLRDGLSKSASGTQHSRSSTIHFNSLAGPCVVAKGHDAESQSWILSMLRESYTLRRPHFPYTRRFQCSEGNGGAIVGVGMAVSRTSPGRHRLCVGQRWSTPSCLLGLGSTFAGISPASALNSPFLSRYACFHSQDFATGPCRTTPKNGYEFASAFAG